MQYEAMKPDVRHINFVTANISPSNSCEELLALQVASNAGASCCTPQWRTHNSCQISCGLCGWACLACLPSAPSDPAASVSVCLCKVHPLHQNADINCLLERLCWN